MSTPEIRLARGPQDMEAVRRLFLAYANSLGFSLCFQGFDTELETLPAPYAPPRGDIWLASLDGADVGVIAVKPLPEPGVCEMKRLYVDPVARGHALGRRLAETSITFAREAGYREMKLDTIGDGRMAAAGRLYRDLGFRPCADYNGNPIPGVEFMALDLGRAPQEAGGSARGAGLI